MAVGRSSRGLMRRTRHRLGSHRRGPWGATATRQGVRGGTGRRRRTIRSRSRRDDRPHRRV